jgi:hypothetical protein
MTQKKLRFEDLQPHVDMLIDALENKGASSSGIPHSKGVMDNADRYRELLRDIRAKNKKFEDLVYDLHLLNHQTIQAAGENQFLRIEKIIKALDFFIMKEYNRIQEIKL